MRRTRRSPARVLRGDVRTCWGERTDKFLWRFGEEEKSTLMLSLESLSAVDPAAVAMSNMSNASQSNSSTHILVDDVTPDPSSIDSENKDPKSGGDIRQRLIGPIKSGDDMVPKFGNHKFDPEVKKALFAQMIARHD
ncbi:hypothetical protein LguiA_021629 [Lonicera macranthoides]